MPSQKYLTNNLPKVLNLVCLMLLATPQMSNAQTLATNPNLIAQADNDQGAALTPRQALRQRRIQQYLQNNNQGNNDNATLPNPSDNQDNNQPLRQRVNANGAIKGGNRGGNPKPQGPFGGALDLSILNLSDEQKQQIRQMRQQDAPKARAIKQIVRAKRIELRDLMFDPSASDAQIHGARKELRKVQEQLEDLQFSDFMQLRNILTAEQKLQLPDIRPIKPKAQQSAKPEAQAPVNKDN